MESFTFTILKPNKLSTMDHCTQEGPSSVLLRKSTEVSLPDQVGDLGVTRCPPRRG